MEPILAKVLVQRGVIRQGTVLEAVQSAKGLSGVCDSFALQRYVVLAASVSDGWVYFTVAVNPEERQRIRCDYVASIDGMLIERVITAHQLRSDGSEIKGKPRRSRTKRQPMLLGYEHNHGSF
jgi:hypothetical protein